MHSTKTQEGSNSDQVQVHMAETRTAHSIVADSPAYTSSRADSLHHRARYRWSFFFSFFLHPDDPGWTLLFFSFLFFSFLFFSFLFFSFFLSHFFYFLFFLSCLSYIKLQQGNQWSTESSFYIVIKRGMTFLSTRCFYLGLHWLPSPLFWTTFCRPSNRSICIWL